MKLIIGLLWIVTATPAFCQLDTVYYDDFSKNKTVFHYPRRKDGLVKIEHGHARQIASDRKFIFYSEVYYWAIRFNAPLNKPDTFVYEIKMEINGKDVAGPALGFEGKLTPYAFYGFFAGRKYVSLRHFWFGVSDNTTTLLATPAPELNTNQYHFKLAWGNGTLYFFCNDKLYYSKKTYRKQAWNEWGWVMLKSGDIKVDYVLLRSK